MAGIIGLILVIGVIGVAIWKRCEIYPPMCGGTGDSREPFDTTGKSLSKEALRLATTAPTGPIQKVPDRIFTIDTTGGGLTDAQKKIAGAAYTRTLSQHGQRLFI